MDEFVFQITQDEFLEFLFDDLELPNLIKRQLAGVDSFKYMRAGVVNDGNPSKINIVRSMETGSGTAHRAHLGMPKKYQSYGKRNRKPRISRFHITRQ